ncbi:hypothetical protein BDV18DRAFT_160419 [Aspergillus unguis]
MNSVRETIQLRRLRRRMPPGSSSGPISGTITGSNTNPDPRAGPSRIIPRAQLTIPRVPKFPLSSPITDEVASPSGTSEEEEEDQYRAREIRAREQYKNWDPVEERTRPFDFLTKMSDAKQTQPQPQTKSRNPFLARVNTALGDKSERVRVFEESVTHGEVQSSTATARRNPERPVGLNLDIPKSTPPSQPQRKETAGAFVDLNDLKNLSQAREEERTAQKLKGILKKGDAKRNNGDTRGFHRLEDEPEDTCERKNRKSLLDAVSKPRKNAREHHGISPTDRPIMIGFSVPYDSPELESELGEGQKEKELDSATTLHTPLTPSIIVTPAREDGFWSHLSPEDTHTNHNYTNTNTSSRPRAVSSVYSQSSPHLGLGKDVPPVPALPAFYSSGNDSSAYVSASPGIVSDNVRKRRSLSASVVNETTEKSEDEDQIGGRPRSRSIEKPKSRPADRLTINTALNARASQGWWNYLLSPLLSASSLFSPKTPSKHRPSLPAISTSSEATGLTDEWWEEKQQWEKDEKSLERSYFSPDTPEVTRRVSSWQTMTPANPFADFDWSIDEQNQTQSPEQNRDAASMMFSGQRIQGAAAEYYQACAHELFSGRPYFECENHICSITPEDKAIAGPALDTEAEGQRGGLLIDVDDTPRSTNLASPTSAITSINSSPSDDAGRMSRDLRTSMQSRPAPTAGMPSPTPEDPNTKQPSPVVPSNPFAQEQSRRLSPPMTQAPPPAPAPAPANIHIESAAAPPPANIHIEAPAAQPAPSIHYPAPAPVPPPAPTVLDGPNPYEAPRGVPEPAPFEAPRAMPEPSAEQARSRPVPAPIAMPSPEQTPPPNYGAQAYSPYPRSPESLQETTDRSAIRLSHMPAGPAPAYTPHDNSFYPHPNPQDAALPPRMRAAPITREALTHPTTAQDRIEARRRRHEREDTLATKAGGFWRGRGPVSKRGCFGRKGREGRLRRRWYAAICLFFIAIVVGAILLAVFLTRTGDGTPVQSQWLNLTGYPPMPTGISTIAGPEAQVQESGCIQPTSMWSCKLPREQQGGNNGYDPDQPSFRLEIRFQNGSYDHSTTLAARSVSESESGSASASTSESKSRPLSALSLLKRSANQLFNPSPDPPSAKEQSFLGQYTDNNTEPYNGEETPFYITVLSAKYVSSSSATPASSSLDKRDTNTTSSSSNNTSTTFPDVKGLIPSPPVGSDGTAAAATLYPLPSSQPVRLYNRGKKDEHYGFYTYFDKSIFLSSDAPFTGGVKNAKGDLDGGSKKEDARVRCTWAQTRFLVQIWTGNSTGKHLLSGDGNSTATATSTNGTSTATPTSNSTNTSSPSSSATDFTRPGSFPYPITITLDRHGGNVDEKLVYCYGMEEDMHINGTEKKLQLENRAFAGSIVNEAPGLFNTTDKDEDNDYGGYDGGQGGCSCRWVNWVGAV